jgi:hypothetical protein
LGREARGRRMKPIKNANYEHCAIKFKIDDGTPVGTPRPEACANPAINGKVRDSLRRLLPFRRPRHSVYGVRPVFRDAARGRKRASGCISVYIGLNRLISGYFRGGRHENTKAQGRMKNSVSAVCRPGRRAREGNSFGGTPKCFHTGNTRETRVLPRKRKTSAK